MDFSPGDVDQDESNAPPTDAVTPETGVIVSVSDAG